MQNTIQRNTHSITSLRTQNIHRDNENHTEQNHTPVDTYTPTENNSAGLYDPGMFRRRFNNSNINSNGTSHSIHSTPRDNGYGGRRLSASGARQAHVVYRRHGNQQMDLSDRNQVGRLISRSPQIDNQRTNGDEDRCGGAAVMNAMLLDGDHQQNARAIRETMGSELTPQQRTALDHMEAGRLSPNEAAQLQEAIYDHSNARDGRANQGLNRADMRDTVAELRRHGAFQNTRELNFRREQTDNGGSHWTVSSRTNHGTHFADSYPQDNGYARVSGGDQAAFAPWDAEDRPMLDSVVMRNNDRGNPVIDERSPNSRTGAWQQQTYSLEQAQSPYAQPRPYALPDTI